MAKLKSLLNLCSRPTKMAKINMISSSNLFGIARTNAISNTRMGLTPLDHRLLPFSPIQEGLLYHKPQSQDFEFKTFIHHMKNSLSRTLDFFPPLAGRLGCVKNYDNNMMSLFLDCNNAGVEFTHAAAEGVSVSDILEPTYVPEIVSSFFVDTGLTNYEGISNPLLAVQITELVDGYFIGCTANHAVVDGNSFWHFVNSWSEISRGCDSISKKPSFERDWFPSNNTHNFIPIDHSKSNFSLPPLLNRVFHFSRENIAILKAKANSEAGTNKISSLQAVSAHLWRTVSRIRHVNRGGSGYDQYQICVCGLPVGLRGRIPNCPDGYFGNAVFPVRFATSEAELLSNEIGWAALKLNEMVAQQSSEKTVAQFLNGWVRSTSTTQTTERINLTLITGSARFDVYGNDFGWGKPVATRGGATLKILDGAMTVSPAPESAGGGLHVLACLDPQIMRAMGEDLEFKEVVTN